MITRTSLLCLLFLVVGGQGCSIDCGGDKLCTDNIYGYYGADCSGFLACVNKTTPCAGVCPHDVPVLSRDGLSCSACTDTGVCPTCLEDEVWCGVEGACKLNVQKCGGKCNTIHRPVFKDGECKPCPDYNRWCKEEEKCYDPEKEPCNGKCEVWGTRYCRKAQLCVDEGIPCPRIKRGRLGGRLKKNIDDSGL